MKFSIAAIAAATASVVAAQGALQISEPTVGTVWTVDKEVFINWQGNCAGQGSAGATPGTNVSIDLINGPATNVVTVAILGTLDCTNPAKTRHTFTLKGDMPSGEYSIRLQTSPVSYSNKFQIVNPSSQPPAPTTTSAPEQPKPTGAASSILAKTGAMAVAAVAAAAYLF